MHDHQISQSPLHPLPPQSAHPCRLSSLCRTYQANKICHCRINNNRNTFFSNLKKEKMLSQRCFQSFMKECTWVRSRKHFTTAFFFIFTLYFHYISIFWGIWGQYFFFIFILYFHILGNIGSIKVRKNYPGLYRGKFYKKEH